MRRRSRRSAFWSLTSALVLTASFVGASFPPSFAFPEQSGKVLSANEVVVYSNDFSSSIGSEWSGNAGILTTPSSERVLGSTTQFGSPDLVVNETVALTLTGLPTHSSMDLSVDLYTVKSWDGNRTDFGPDSWDLNVTGTSSDVQPLSTFSNFVGVNQAYPDAYPGGSHPGMTGAAATGDLLGLGSSGNGEIPAARYGFNHSFAHTANSVTFNFAGSNLQHAFDEGWVLDNVVVSVTEVPPTTISGDLSCNSVFGNGFASNSSASVVVKDAPAGATVYTNPSVPTGDNGNFNLFCGFGPNLVPGMEITVSDGSATKVLVLADLTIDVVDPATDVVSGTAPPGAEVNVGVNNPPSGGGANLNTTADGTGNWSVDFTGTFDITGGSHANASVPDADGDSTNVNKFPPTISGDLSCNSINGNGFASNSSVSVVVKDAPGAATVYTNPSVPTGGNGNFNLFCGFGPDLGPGMEITVSDGSATKVLVLADLTIDVVDPATDVVTGTAPANSSLFVGVNNPPSPGGAGLNTTADGAGNWSLDFTGTFDITGGTHANASVHDGDGDSTNVNKFPPVISGDLSCDSVFGNGFASNSSASVVVKDAPGGATVYTNPTVPIGGNGSFNLFCNFGPDLVAGMEITASDGSATKVLVLADLTIDAVNPSADTVSGTAPPGAQVNVGVNDPPSGGGANLTITAVGTGAWSVDFTGVFDITGGTHANASVHDEDGDSTNVNRSAPEAPAFEGSLSGDYAAGCGFSANASVDVAVYDAPGGTLLMSGSAPSDDGGCFNFDPGVDMVPGMFITVDDGALLKELALVPLSIDVIDPPNDSVSGTALENTTFNVDAFVEEGWVSAFPVTSDGTGAWTAEFGPLGADINPFTHVGANIGDDDGDQTIFDTQLQQGGQNAFTDPNDFQNAIGSHTVIDFNEIDASPVNNTWVGRDPFDGAHYAASGITFSNPNGYNLYIAPGGLFWNESNSLSVRQFPFDDNADDGNDDDLVVDLVPARIAVGFTMVDNGSHDEFIQFLDADGNLVDQVSFPDDYANHRAFIGIVSTDQPIAKIKIVELAFDGDDVDYDDFILVDTLSAADLALTKSDPPGRAPTGRDLTYTLTVVNNGPDAASGVTVTDQLPPSVTFVSATPSQGSCGESGGTVTCNLVTMGSGATATVDIVVKPTVAGTITNTASVTASTPDPNQGNNSDSESTSICRITSRRSSIPCG